jgi:chemotaxis protein CheD
MKQYTLNIGDVQTSLKPATYTCFGLGSCVGIFLQDRITGISGGAHILLPGDEAGPCAKKFYNVSMAMEELLKQFRSWGSDLMAIRAKVTGGANVLSTSPFFTGKNNSESVVEHLVSNRIFIAAKDLGGCYARTANFQSDTGKLIVRMPQLNQYKIY